MKLIVLAVIIITLIIPIVVALLQTLVGKLVAVTWYYIGFLLYACGIVLVEETIRSIYYMEKVA